MASQFFSRLGIVLGIDTAELSADVEKAIEENRKLKRGITAEAKAIEKEMAALKFATENYGKSITKVAQLQQEFAMGKYAKLPESSRQALLAQAAAYDKIAESAKKAAQAQFGGSGKMNQQQLAALGYQTTDILTGLASGQNPLLVLIQQGGQLRDQFGGFIPLFKGIASVFTLTRVIAGSLGGALVGLAYAAFKGNEDFKELRNSIALTNNVMGVTYDSVNRLKTGLADGLNISLSDSKDIFIELIKSGKFSADTMESVAKVIGNVSKLSGESADVVAKSLIPAFDGTAASAKSLNEKFNFLTFAQYRQIETLDRLGERQKAAKMTADLLNASIERQRETLQITDSWWSRLTKTVSDFWEKLKSFGAPETEEQALVSAARRIEFLAQRYESNKNERTKARLDVEISNYLQMYEDMMKKRTQIDEKAAKQQIENQKTTNWALAGGEEKYRDILESAAKIRADREFQERVAGADKFRRIDLEAEKKHQEALVELAKKNRETRGMMEAAVIQEYLEKAAAIESEANQKKLEISRLAAEEVRKEQQTRLDSVETEKEKLKIYEENLFISEKDYKIALNRLKAEQEIAKIKANPDLLEKDKDEATTRAKNIQARSDELAVLEEKLKHLREVNQSVWRNMESALENFVRTGKFSFKDFARSVIQDILLIYMKSQMLQMFNMGKGALSNFFSGGTNMYTDSSGMFQVGMALAEGGEPPVGVPSLVGEKGPELFVPKTAGTIIPNHKLSDAMGGTTYVTNNYIDAIDTKSFEQRLLGSHNTIWAANQYATKSLAVSRGRT